MTKRVILSSILLKADCAVVSALSDVLEALGLRFWREMVLGGNLLENVP